MRTQIQSVWVMHSESVLTQNFLFSNSEGKWRCKSRCGRARRRPWLRARRRPWRLCGGGGRDPAAREPRQEAAMAAREDEAMADLRRRASRGGRRPWRSTGSRNPFAGGRDPFARTSSPSAAPPPWSHLIAPAAPRRGPTSPRQPRPAAAATLRPRTGICVEEREEPIFALHGVLPILGLLFGSAVGARFLPVA